MGLVSPLSLEGETGGRIELSAAWTLGRRRRGKMFSHIFGFFHKVLFNHTTQTVMTQLVRSDFLGPTIRITCLHRAKGGAV